MVYLMVGMNQGALLPRSVQGYERLSTHGIDSCTGLVLVSRDEIFLTHIPPAHGDTEFRTKYKSMIDGALALMSGDVQATVVSPNKMFKTDAGAWTGESPNSGSIYIANTLDILYKWREEGGAAPRCKLVDIEYKSGNKISVPREGRLEVAEGAFQSNEYRQRDGGSENQWLLINCR